jgi:hypothetical protein
MEKCENLFTSMVEDVLPLRLRRLADSSRALDQPTISGLSRRSPWEEVVTVTWSGHRNLGYRAYWGPAEGARGSLVSLRLIGYSL